MTFFQAINSYITKQKTRRALRDLPEHLYKDIGKTAAQVEQEYNKASLSITLANKLDKKVKGFKFKQLKA